MADVTFRGLPTEAARHYQAGGLDAYGQPPERALSDGQGNPCRHCLKPIAEGRDYLILAHRPFGALQPYAETGPIFLCADPCEPWEGQGVPPAQQLAPDYLLKAYDGRERIIYGRGRVVPQGELVGHAAALLDRPDVNFVDLRSARYNCWQARITRR